MPERLACSAASKNSVAAAAARLPQCPSRAVLAVDRSLAPGGLAAFGQEVAVPDTFHMLVWCPVASSEAELPVDAGSPVFLAGAVSATAPFADGRRHPLVLIWHGAGGAARQRIWLGTTLARGQRRRCRGSELPTPPGGSPL